MLILAGVLLYLFKIAINTSMQSPQKPPIFDGSE
jgi:hypothetical protein